MTAGPVRTVGVEEELLLVDAESGRPRAVANQVLQATGPAHEAWGRVDLELQQEQIETDTAPRHELADLERELRRGREVVVESARAVGARVVASGTSPLAAAPTLVTRTRYRRMARTFGLTVAEQLSCGCHVHVSVDSAEEAVAAVDRVREWLPALLAVSTNSPFWQGRDSGYASFRAQVWARWPSAGPTEVFGDLESYRRHVRRSLATGVLLDEGMLYADVRPSRRYPTVELRVADVCQDVRDAVAVAGLARALVDVAIADWRAGIPPIGTPVSLLRLAGWRASKEGLDGQLLDPREQVPRPATEVIGSLLAHCAESLAANGDLGRVSQRLEHLLAHGTGATRQWATYRRTGRLEDVVDELARVTAGSAE